MIWRILGALILVTLCVAYVATREHAPIVNVRWSTSVDAQERASLIRTYDLARCSSSDDRTNTCELLDTSSSNIAAIVGDTRIEDTYHIDRADLRVRPDADRAVHVTWIAHSTPLTRLRGSIEGMVIIALALVISHPIARRRARTRAEGREFVSDNVTLGALGLGLFALLYLATGQIDVEGGLGYDGRVYAAMLEQGVLAGTRFTVMRPLIVLIARIPYYFTQDVILSFEILNFIFAFAQAYLLAKLADVYHVTRTAKLYLVISLAVCIATAKMFAYYPVLVDFGGYVMLLGAIYAILEAPLPVAAVAVCVSVAAREFGVAAALFGIHRALRRREGIAAMLAYLPAVGVFAVLRYVSATQAAQGYSIFEILKQNLGHWHEFWYIASLAYFLLTIFGGISLILAARPLDGMRLLIEEPEWATFAATIVGFTCVFGEDIWRYLAFTLPLAVALFARASASWTPREKVWLYTIGAVATWYTQRPFERFSLLSYFRDWFPYYVAYLDSSPFPPGILWPVWRWRYGVTGMLLLLLALSHVWRRPRREIEPDVALIRNKNLRLDENAARALTSSRPT